MKAVIPAAGFGTRFLPLTKAQPKEMLPVVNKPTIQWVVEEAVDAGITDIAIITGEHKQSIENHFKPMEKLERALEMADKRVELEEIRKVNEIANLEFIIQEEQKGLGHAILCSEHLINEKEPFVVILPDMFILENNKSPALSQMFKRYSETLKGQLLAKKISKKESNKFGIIDIGKKLSPSKGFHEVRGLTEKPIPIEAASNLA